MNRATGFTPNSASFFSLVREHTLQGTFCDPYYGGNANFVGWDLIGYPGVLIAGIPSRDQQVDVQIKSAHRSAYSYDRWKPGAKKKTKMAENGGSQAH